MILSIALFLHMFFRCMDYKKMYAWLAFVVGDTTAGDLVKEWEEEAREIAGRL